MAETSTISKPKRTSDTPRKRVSQACDRCRARKDKCDGQRPVCSTCAAQDAVCNYDSNTKKRGLPEGYVRGIEKLWGLSIRQVENIEDNVLQVLAKDSTAEAWNEVANGVESLQDTWRNSQIAKELERLLPLLEIEDKGVKRKRDGGRGDSLNETKPAIRPATKAEGEHNNTIFPSEGALRPQSLYTVPREQNVGIGGFGNRPSNIDPAIECAATQQASLPMADQTRQSQPYRIPPSDMPGALPERTFRLIDIYFSYTHTWFPVLEKYDIMRISHQYSLTKGPATSLDSSTSKTGNHAVLWAILAYADQQRLAFTEPQEPSSAKMYEFARRLIPDEDGEYDLGHVQALLILTLYLMGKGLWKRAWHLVGKAVRIATEIGLDQLESPWSKRSQHVYLGCFVLDTIVAARLKRKPQLRRDDLGRIQRVEEDGLEEWDPCNDALGVSTTEASRAPAAILSTWNQLVRITAILNDTICLSPGPSISPSSHQSLLLDLDSLNHFLPPQFRPAWAPKEDDQYFNGPILPHQYHLHMAYISTRANLYMSARAQGFHLDIRVEDIAASSIRQTAKLLKHHAQHFGLLIMPPTYDYYTMVAGLCAIIDHNPLDDYRLDIQHALSTMRRAWPTYYIIDGLFSTGDLGQIPEDVNLDTRPLASAVAPAATPSSKSQMSPGTMDHREPSIPGSTFIPPKAILPSTAAVTPTERMPVVSPSLSRYNSNDRERSSNIGKSSAVDMAMSSVQQPSPTATFLPHTPAAASWSGTTPGRDNFNGVSQHTASIFDGVPNNLEIDGDSMFNEFATLDAMEWTNNWDQSLLNLGFTDPSTMNQDFYAFARDPDPLYPNDLVQQLLSSSNINVDPAAGDMSHRGMHRANSFGMNNSMPQYTNPHVEASQILQALATAQGRSVGGQKPG